MSKTEILIPVKMGKGTGFGQFYHKHIKTQDGIEVDLRKFNSTVNKNGELWVSAGTDTKAVLIFTGTPTHCKFIENIIWNDNINWMDLSSYPDIKIRMVDLEQETVNPK